MTARVRAEQDRARYLRGLYGDARADALRDAEALLKALRGGASLRRIHFAAYRAHMSAAAVYGYSAHAAHARKRLAAVRAGKRGRCDLGWPYAPDVYDAQGKRRRAAA